jgi:hypothetical protein
MTIYKYPLRVDDRQKVEMPRGARVLCAQVQLGSPCVWALVDENETAKDTVILLTYGTGHYMSPTQAKDNEYVGTYQLAGGDLVFHVFRDVA